VNLPRSSAYARLSAPETVEWGLTEQLLAAAVDALAISNWIASGANRRDRPRPIPRPGVEPETTTYGKGAIPLDEMAAWLGDT
jgi:hypothetical protein